MSENISEADETKAENHFPKLLLPARSKLTSVLLSTKPGTLLLWKVASDASACERSLPRRFWFGNSQCTTLLLWSCPRGAGALNLSIRRFCFGKAQTPRYISLSTHRKDPCSNQVFLEPTWLSKTLSELLDKMSYMPESVSIPEGQSKTGQVPARMMHALLFQVTTPLYAHLPVSFFISMRLPTVLSNPRADRSCTAHEHYARKGSQDASEADATRMSWQMLHVKLCF